MTTWIDHKYIGLLSNKVEKFKRKGPNLYNFRCPICNDSEKNKSKARGYIYEKNGNMLFHCHNCNATNSLANFIKLIDYSLYSEYLLEKMKEKSSSKEDDNLVSFKHSAPPIFADLGPIKSLRKVSQLSEIHPVREFVEARKIPEEYYSKLYACPNFLAFTNIIIPSKFSESALKHDQTRLLIPFLDENKALHAYTGRVITSSANNVKYIMIVTNHDKPKVYGLDRVDFTKTIPVLEGPIDSMFIKNSLATGGGDLISAVAPFDRTKLVIVYDNEPRSKETISKLHKAIHHGYKVCLWPDYIEEKDVNDMVLSGMSIDHIEDIIRSNTYHGLKATLALNNWKKI